MNLIEVRQRLHDMCEEAGSAVAFVEKYGKEHGLKSHSHVSAVKRGDIKPGRKLLKAMGLQKAFTPKKNGYVKYEDITN